VDRRKKGHSVSISAPLTTKMQVDQIAVSK